MFALEARPALRSESRPILRSGPSSNPAGAAGLYRKGPCERAKILAQSSSDDDMECLGCEPPWEETVCMSSSPPLEVLVGMC
jgi:hypothetical protein